MNNLMQKLSITKPTPEFLGGLIAGAGLATVVAWSYSRHGIEYGRSPFIYIGGLLLIPIGSFIARAAQRRKLKDAQMQPSL